MGIEYWAGMTVLEIDNGDSQCPQIIKMENFIFYHNLKNECAISQWTVCSEWVNCIEYGFSNFKKVMGLSTAKISPSSSSAQQISEAAGPEQDTVVLLLGVSFLPA